MPPVPPYGAIAERRVIERLLAADAVSEGSAQALEHLRALEARRLPRLLADGVVREASGGRYYIHAPALAAHLAARRTRVLVAMILVVTLVAAMSALGTIAAAR